MERQYKLCTIARETNQIRKQVCETWQFGADGPAECAQNESQPRVAVAITDDGAISDTIRASSWFYRNNDEVSPNVIPQYLAGTTTTSFNPNSGAISTRTLRVRIDLINILIPGEYIELDFPHHVVISMPDNSQTLVGRVVTGKKRDARPHNRYLAPDNLGVIEAVCPQAMAFIVRVPLNQRLTFIRFWDAQFVGELSACLHCRICNDSMPFVVPTQDGHGYEMKTYYNDECYDWMDIGWANGSPYNRIYNSDDFILIEFLLSNHREAVLQLNWCFYNFWLLLHSFEYFQVRADGTLITRSATQISKAWAGREHTKNVAHCDELVGKFDNGVMNREHNSLATALEQVRTILMEVPNCNGRGNYMEAFLGCTVQIATDGIFASLFRFAIYLNDIYGFHANDVAVCLRAIACKIWRILYICFGRKRDGVDPYAFRYGEQVANNNIDRDFAATYPAQRVPQGGFTEDTSLNNLSLWIKMDGRDTCNPERMPFEWSDHSVKIFDILGKVHSKLNPSWEKLQSLGLHNGKAYSTPTDEPTTGHEHKCAVPTEYFDIPNNDVPPLQLHIECQGTEMFYMYAQVTEVSRNLAKQLGRQR